MGGAHLSWVTEYLDLSIDQQENGKVLRMRSPLVTDTLPKIPGNCLLSGSEGSLGIEIPSAEVKDTDLKGGVH